MTVNRVAQDIDAQARIARTFSRFYVRRIGLLDGGLLKGIFSLTQIHVLYELANRKELTATELQKELDLDKGYLSRILKKFADDGLILKQKSPEDARQSILTLTHKGREVFEPLEQSSQARSVRMLSTLSTSERARMISAMHTIHHLLGDCPTPDKSCNLREMRPGDLGWLVHRHGVIYSREFGWDETFEATVATILGEYAGREAREDERSWIAESESEILGSIFCMRQTDSVAQLRVFYVEPEARGLGIGSRLIGECINFARSKGYRQLVLRTSQTLAAARSLYEAHGFTLAKEWHVRQFGHDIIDQDWELEL